MGWRVKGKRILGVFGCLLPSNLKGRKRRNSGDLEILEFFLIFGNINEQCNLIFFEWIWDLDLGFVVGEDLEQKENI